MRNTQILKLQQKIAQLKIERNAILLAHYYQIPEIQDIADYLGDSLGLSQQALKTSANVILFAGVHFMAETAKILNPEKKVIIPDLQAGCSLADSCQPVAFKKFIEDYPGHIVISYINCSAEIKAMSDIICTSGNALKIVNSLSKKEKIIFAPDKNLGNYISTITGRKMVLWEGSCEVHENIKSEMILKFKEKHKDAVLIAHPECKPIVLEMADFIGSTTALINFVKHSLSKKFIVATETGILHQMKKEAPSKEFIIIPVDETCSCNDCPYMKMNTLEKIYTSLLNLQPELILPEELMIRAKKPIMRMLELSNI